MGLDALGDSYWIADDGRKLMMAIEWGNADGVKRELGSKDEMFSDAADSALIYACERSKDAKYAEIVDVLLEHPYFPNQLSYVGLVLAKKTAEKNYKQEKTIKKVAEALAKRTGEISHMGVEAYIRKIKSHTVYNASDQKVMLKNPADAIAFAAYNGDMQGMIKLAEIGMHKYLDDVVFAFAKREAGRNPGIGQVIGYVLDTMAERRKMADAIETIDEGIVTMKEGAKELKMEMRNVLKTERRKQANRLKA